MPAFTQVLDAVSAAWRDRRDEVVASAAGIAAQLSEQRLVAAPGAVTPADLDAARATLARDFDPTYGGFGRAPKFPPSMVLEALLRDGSPGRGRHGRSGPARRWPGAGSTTSSAAGFARYSVDAQWVVPHFEKMLYDNALLLGVYVHLWRRTGDPLAERVVVETVEWLLRELRTPEGAFAASLDADSLDATGHLHEGAFYAWTPEHLVEVLGTRGRRVGGAGVQRDDGGDVRARHLDAAAARAWGRTSPTRLADVRARLAAAREQRARPGRDDKVVAAWNGWLVDALVEAALVLDRPDWLRGGARGRGAAVGGALAARRRPPAPHLARRAGGRGRRDPRGPRRPRRGVRPARLRDRRPGLGRAGADAAGRRGGAVRGRAGRLLRHRRRRRGPLHPARRTPPTTRRRRGSARRCGRSG